jgi:hypothetical protein
LSTVATAVLLLLHVPPVVASESVDCAPVQALAVPVMAATEGGYSNVVVMVLLADEVPHALLAVA